MNSPAIYGRVKFFWLKPDGIFYFSAPRAKAHGYSERQQNAK